MKKKLLIHGGSSLISKYFLRNCVDEFNEFHIFCRDAIKTKSNFYDGMPFCHQSFIFKKKLGMKFSEDYKICGDYDFVIKWFSKRFTSPLKIRKLNKLHTIFDINGISSKKRFERDIEGYFVILRNYGILKSIFYLINRIKKYLEVKIY